jgi:hypothetical protein
VLTIYHNSWLPTAKTFRNAELQFTHACLIHGEIEVAAPWGLNNVPPRDKVMHLGYQLEPRVGKSHNARHKYIPTHCQNLPISAPSLQASDQYQQETADVTNEEGLS